MSYVVLLVSVGVTIYALVDCWRSSDDEVRGLPRLTWMIIIVFPLFWLVGGLAYLVFGRSRGVLSGPERSRVTAPDDDPEFLYQLGQEQRRAAAEARRVQEQREKRERKDRERSDRQQRRERKTGSDDTAGPESADGDDHSDHPTG